MAISFNSLVGHPCGQVGCQKMLKSSRNLNLLDFCSTFQPKVNKFQKTTRNREKGMIWGQFFKLIHFWLKSRAKIQQNQIP